MHGTIACPDEIVLSKRDYMRYHDRFAAMAGIVQSTLLTRHLLFVGFSLDDDNFQRIFDSVRKARRPAVGDTDLAENFLSAQRTRKLMRDKASKYLKGKANYPIYGMDDIEDDENPDEYSDVCGTAIMLEYSPLKVLNANVLSMSTKINTCYRVDKGEIWDGDIDLVYLQEKNERNNYIGGKSDFDRLARIQEIFLDVLSSRCSQCGHIKFIFNDRYADALTPGEIEFKDCIKNFESQLGRYFLATILSYYFFKIVILCFLFP